MRRTVQVTDHTVAALRTALAGLPEDAEVRVRVSMTISRDGGLAKSVTVRQDDAAARSAGPVLRRH